MRPNVLIIVMDCVGAADFETEVATPGHAPNLARLRDDCVAYPRAATVAPWTVPSHTSLFSGLYPWEHGVHGARGTSGLRVDRATPLLQRLLGGAGYRSLCVTANWFLGPDAGFGLTDGFDSVICADWWEKYLRFRREAPDPDGPDPATEPGRVGLVRGGLQRVEDRAFRIPLLANVASELLQRVRYPGTPASMAISPWIEPVIESWVAGQPRDRPLYCFVNLIDAHEPYYSDLQGRSGLVARTRRELVRQDSTSWLRGVWDPNRHELDALRSLYRESIRRLDRRVARIVSAFDAPARENGTMVVLTSDHGQAFGDEGILFHMYGLSDSLARVPLWVRFPDGLAEGSSAEGWASLVDVVPTVLEAADVPGPELASAVSLRRLLRAPRPAPAYCVSDGMFIESMRRLASSERIRQLDRVRVAAFDDARKVIVDPTDGRVAWFDSVTGRPAGGGSLETYRDEGLVASALEIARVMTGSGARTAEPEVDARLRSWGYD